MMGSGRSRGTARAKEAAEAAISSPLLEDVNLAGAKGILVNITSGMDMTMGEFEEVGNTVKSFASDNATVVVGTVIDPAMEGEVRVTVVATGIGVEPRAAKEPEPVKAREPEVAPAPVVKAAEPRETDYAKLERPTVIRNRAELYDHVSANTRPEILDIPAFLRRQAD